MGDDTQKCNNCEMAGPDRPGGFMGAKEGTPFSVFGARIISASRGRCGCIEAICVVYSDNHSIWHRLITKRSLLSTMVRKQLGAIPFNQQTLFAVPLEVEFTGTIVGTDDPPEDFTRDGPSVVIINARIS